MTPKIYTVKLHVNNSLLEFTIHDDLIINYDNYEYSKHAYLLHDAGFPICIVFADNESDAIDEAFDRKKLDEYALTEDDEVQYKKDGLIDSIIFAGNNVTPVDIESITILELPKPKQLSYCATIISTEGCSCTGESHDGQTKPNK